MRFVNKQTYYYSDIFILYDMSVKSHYHNSSPSLLTKSLKIKTIIVIVKLKYSLVTHLMLAINQNDAEKDTYNL